MRTLVIWLVAVLAISLMPLEGGRTVFPHADKLLHFLIYAVTCALFVIVLTPPLTKKGMLFGRIVVVSVVLSSAYGLLIEVFQKIVPGRSFSLLDALSNTLGALAGASYVIIKRRKK